MFNTLFDLFNRDRCDLPGGRRSGLRGMLDTVLEDDRRRNDDHLHDGMDDDLDSEHRRSTRRGSALDWD